MSIQIAEVVIGKVYEGRGGLQKKVVAVDTDNKTVTFEVIRHGEREPKEMPVGSTHTKPIGAFANWTATIVG
jgi:hypothetical protein